MSEDQDLLARIGQLAGQINLHKNHSPSPVSFDYLKQSRSSTSQGSTASTKIYQPFPYSRPRGRAAKPILNSHRNRTLVLKQLSERSQSPNLNESAELTAESATSTTKPFADNTSSSLKPAISWVAKRDRHMQLINSSIFDKETQMRNKAIDETRRQKALQNDQREKLRLEKLLQRSSIFTAQIPHIPTDTASTPTNEIVIDGLTFQVIGGGNKLLRLWRTSDLGRLTPKKVNLAGVNFFRSKNGNLYRSSLARVQKDHRRLPKKSAPCKRFTTTGRCPKGPQCRYVHDPNAVAICKEFLQKGVCPAGDYCDLSHDPTPERVPACVHFLRGKCSNQSCRYAHVHVGPSALVCRDFAGLGYCKKGAQCSERHIYECPDYANTGICRVRNCHMPHVDRAGQIKHQNANTTEMVQSNTVKVEEDDNSDILSDKEFNSDADSDDIDSDIVEECFPHSSDDLGGQNLSQQEDFVQFY